MRMSKAVNFTPSAEKTEQERGPLTAREFRLAIERADGTGAIGAVVKTQRRLVSARFFADGVRGDRIAGVLSRETDVAISTIFKRAADAATKRVAVVASGGYGRGKLAPHSDVDLLILHERIADADLKRIVEALLYPLWDADLIVGHAVHTPSSAVKFAQEDLNGQTAFLDARLICGARDVAETFFEKYAALMDRTRSAFIAGKLAEQRERHARADESRYLAEPDVKEGKGALRDIHSIEWIRRAHEAGEASDDPLIGEEEARSLSKAARFFWSLRVNLHDLRGRADEKITFDVQPQLAERLGYAHRAGISASERMMKHYFLHAMDVGRVMRIFLARLDAQNAGARAETVAALPPALARDEFGDDVNLCLKHNKLDFIDDERAAREPSDLFRLFRAFSKAAHFDFHPEAIATTTAAAPTITTEVRRAPPIIKLFMAALIEAEKPRKLLRVMSETGVLGKFIPMIGKITGRVEYGLYRRFSIDEHLFRSIAVLKQLIDGTLAADHPIATGIVEELKRPDIFYLTVLLHEAAWANKNRDMDAAKRSVARVAKRLGLDKEDADRVAWCASRRRSLVEVAQRRNMGDPQSITRFAQDVGGPARLDLMLVLSVCHLRAIGGEAWDDWTRRQIAALFGGAHAYLAGGEPALERWFADRTAAVRAEVSKMIEGRPASAAHGFLKRISDELATALDVETIVRIGDALAHADEENARSSVALSQRGDGIEAIVLAEDRAGLLADLAGAVASVGASVRNVRATPFGDERVIDVFTIESPPGVDLTVDPSFMARLRAAMSEAALGPPASPPTLVRRVGDRRAVFSVPPKVRLDLDASESCLVVEAEGLDRPGLLYSLAAALSEVGVVIRSAHAATYGERAVDAFYLQDAPGYKIVNERRLQSIERRLMSVLLDE